MFTKNEKGEELASTTATIKRKIKNNNDSLNDVELSC